MIPETVKTPIEKLTREELIALLYELTNRVRELEEKLHLKNTPTTDTAQTSSKSCPKALPSRLVVGEYAYVATDPPLDNRVRKKAGTDYPIIGYIETGNAMKILDGPKCANNWAWWKVQSINKPDLIGWTSEGDDVYWLIPCSSLSSCP